MFLEPVRRYYSKKVSLWGPQPRGADWRDAASQVGRFEQLLKVVPSTGPVLLNDLGCGYGALLSFLHRRRQAHRIRYRGFDISEAMIRQAQQRHRAHRRNFFHIRSAGELFTGDYTLASGVFNVKLRAPKVRWRRYILDTLQAMHKKSRKGFAFNCLTSYSDRPKQRADLYYADPAWFFDYCQRAFSRQVALLHDYGLYEFTILGAKGRGMTDLIVFGTGAIAEMAHYYFSHDSPHRVAAFTVDDAYAPAGTFLDRPVIPFSEITKQRPPDQFQLFLALSYADVNAFRAARYKEARQRGYTLASYVSSRAWLADNVTVGDNCFILENNVVQPFVRLGNNVTLWSGNHIGHHSVIADHVFVSSHVVVSGQVTIGEASFLGVNAAIANGVKVASRSVIGAGAVIAHDTEAGGVYAAASTKRSKLKAERLSMFKRHAPGSR